MHQVVLAIASRPRERRLGSSSFCSLSESIYIFDMFSRFSDFFTDKFDLDCGERGARLCSWLSLWIALLPDASLMTFASGLATQIGQLSKFVCWISIWSCRGGCEEHGWRTMSLLSKALGTTIPLKRSKSSGEGSALWVYTDQFHSMTTIRFKAPLTGMSCRNSIELHIVDRHDVHRIV